MVARWRAWGATRDGARRARPRTAARPRPAADGVARGAYVRPYAGRALANRSVLVYVNVNHLNINNLHFEIMQIIYIAPRARARVACYPRPKHSKYMYRRIIQCTQLGTQLRSAAVDTHTHLVTPRPCRLPDPADPEITLSQPGATTVFRRRSGSGAATATAAAAATAPDLQRAARVLAARAALGGGFSQRAARPLCRNARVATATQ